MNKHDIQKARVERECPIGEFIKNQPIPKEIVVWDWKL